MLGKTLHWRMANDIGCDSYIVRKKPIGRGEGYLRAQRIMSLLQWR